MKQKKKNKNTFFNFRIRESELQRLCNSTRKNGYLSFAEFTRQAIREKISRANKDAK